MFLLLCLGYLLPFIQQVSMHAALAFLLVLTVHRCYPAGVPRFLQGDLIRRQIRNYSQTLCLLWTFAVLINLPLFAITKYEKNTINFTINLENSTNLTYSIVESICYTGANEIWSRTYLILLLVLTYLITGIFLIVIYGQVIRIILASKKYTKNSMRNTPQSNADHYRYLSPNVLNDEKYRSKFVNRSNADLAIPHPSSSSSTANGSLRRQQQTNSSAKPLVVRAPTALERNPLAKTPSTNSHSTQHLQVIIMLFIVIILYILLLLPYRLFNLLYIVHNQIFQQSFMNEILFRWLLNSVRLLVFLNCALQPITYLIISSRLRQTVVKFLRSFYHCSIHCRWSSSSSSSVEFPRHFKTDPRILHKHVAVPIPNLAHRNKAHHYRDVRPLQTSLNNLNPISLHGLPVGQVAALSSRTRSPRAATKSLYTVSFLNRQRK